LQTGVLGGVDPPSVEELTEMSESDYVLHARGGKLTKVPAEKHKLPHDPRGHDQAVSSVLAADGTIYVGLRTTLCKSTDGGRTWSSRDKWCKEDDWPLWQVLSDGTFICVGRVNHGEAWGEGKTVPVPVSISKDEGRTWQQISGIEIPPKYNLRLPFHMLRLPDDTLICAVAPRMTERYADLLAYRSTDKGKTWHGPVLMCDEGHEGGIAQTASGKLLAVLRYQRLPLPSDPPDLCDKTGASGQTNPCTYKHVFLVDSEDGGWSWRNFRQLTTVYGQTRGYPAALSDGTVVVIHDTRYGPGPKGSRAMASYDEGVTWEDEVYYVGGFGNGYNSSVVLEDDLILTINAKSPPAGSWKAAIGRTDVTAIRWKLEKRQ
jgi:hypothetical protein